MIDDQDRVIMRRAIALAQTKGNSPADTPIAAVIVKGGVVIVASVNATKKDHDATAHAEIVAIRAAGNKIGAADLKQSTLYTTLQPCGMCTMASIWANIGRIVYGAGREQVHELYFEDRHLSTMDYIADAYKNDLILEGQCLGDECAALYYQPDDHVPDSNQANK